MLNEELAKPAPACIIFDDLSDAEGDVAKLIMLRLARYARVHRVLVLVLCKMAQMRDVDAECPTVVNDCPTVEVRDLLYPFSYDHADCFIGISKLFTEKGEKDGREVSDKEQFITIRHGEGSSIVPVVSDFTFQRYLPREVEQKAEDPVSLEETVES
ncbi:hypothetical protein [Luteolibacter soli]|uniref:SF4 helicase domain-containing protein n=1 Tax=Luteolibacter soli TaxID=3135280 RepID=A0ABU9AZQ4_9BACT